MAAARAVYAWPHPCCRKDPPRPARVRCRPRGRGRAAAGRRDRRPPGRRRARGAHVGGLRRALVLGAAALTADVTPAPLPQPAVGPTFVRSSAPTNGLAIASLVVGILWMWWIGSILAVVFGHVALRQIARSPYGQSGRGLAIAGLVLGYGGLLLLPLGRPRGRRGLTVAALARTLRACSPTRPSKAGSTPTSQAWRTYDRDAIAAALQRRCELTRTTPTTSRSRAARRSSPTGSPSATNRGAGRRVPAAADHGRPRGGHRRDALCGWQRVLQPLRAALR